MAKLKATPKSYTEASEYLAGRGSVKLGNNTWLERAEESLPCIAVRLHNTRIVRFYASGAVTLYTDGYRTVTTKERLNHFLSGRVSQVKGKGIYETQRYGEDYKDNVTVPFEEGINIA